MAIIAAIDHLRSVDVPRHRQPPHGPRLGPPPRVARARGRGMTCRLVPLRAASLWIAALAVVSLIAGLAAETLDFRALDHDRIARLAEQRHGAHVVQSLRQWRDMMQAGAGLPEEDRARRVNEFFNRRIQFGEDIDIWKVNDFWATPVETMARAAGDCEDFSIAKYFTLRLLGVPDQRLRLIYARARIGGPRSEISQAHMVLGYYADPEAEPLILDNLIHDARPASRRPDLAPVFSFNGEGLWVGNAATGNPSASATARLSRWRDLIARMKTEGFE